MKSNSDSQSFENCVGFCNEPVTCDPPLRGGISITGYRLQEKIPLL